MLLRVALLLALSGLSRAEAQTLESSFPRAQELREKDFILDGMLANQVLRLAKEETDDLKPLTPDLLDILRVRTDHVGEPQKDKRFEPGTKLLKIPLSENITALFLSAPKENSIIQIGYALWEPETRTELQVIYKTGRDLKFISRTVVLFRDNKIAGPKETKVPDSDDRRMIPEIASELAVYASGYDKNGNPKPAPPPSPSKKPVQAEA